MKNILSYILFALGCVFATSTANAQSEYNKMYIVSDKDGYVNVREKPSTQSGILYKLYDKSIVEEKVENNGEWVSVKGGYIRDYDDNGNSIVAEDGYIHRSRLIPLKKELTDSIKTAGKKFLSNGYLRPAYVINKNIPHIVVFEEDCELAIWDIIREEMIYYTCVPVCADIHTDNETLWISETGWLGKSYEDGNNGTISDYKLIKEGNAYKMLCTRFYPVIPKMTREEINKVIKMDNIYDGAGIQAYWLFAAYCNGNKKARELLTDTNNFNLDGSNVHEYSDVISLLYAYESNLKWKELNKKKTKDQPEKK